MRAGALLFCAVHLTAWLGAAWHRATAVHAYCEDHRSVVHVPRPGAEGAGHRGHAVAPAERHDPFEHGCSQLEFLAHSVAAPGGAGAVEPQPVHVHERTRTPEAPILGLRLLRLSPSRSPPPA